jgi:rhodanese-related sulfurtransferase
VNSTVATTSPTGCDPTDTTHQIPTGAAPSAGADEVTPSSDDGTTEAGTTDPSASADPSPPGAAHGSSPPALGADSNGSVTGGVVAPPDPGKHARATIAAAPAATHDRRSVDERNNPTVENLSPRSSAPALPAAVRLSRRFAGNQRSMVKRIDALEAEQLIAVGVRTLDVLPAEVFEKVHIPRATSMPLEEFDPSDVASYDRSEPVVVYCFDQHCDLSARAAARLEQLGFQRVHDLIGGRAAWTALGLPTHGTLADRDRISAFATKVPTVAIDSTLGDVVGLEGQRFPVPVVNRDGVLLGTVAPDPAEPASTRVEDVMLPAPRTIRPEVRLDDAREQLRRDGLDHVLVTAVNGVLVGRVVTEELPAT